jgi:glycerol-3-phosphate O-acyltransferase
MKLGQVPRYTVAELERRAEALLRERCGWPPELPVDIELLADREPGVLLDILPGLQSVCGVAGLVRYEPKTDTMRLLIDADVADHPSASFYRFTVAEELAHVILHRSVMAEIRSGKDLAELHAWAGYSDIDWNTKRFAAALLMPSITVAREARRLYPSLAKEFGFTDSDRLHATLVERLARIHCVSPQAMRKRLKEWPLKITQRVDEALRQQFHSM